MGNTIQNIVEMAEMTDIAAKAMSEVVIVDPEEMADMHVTPMSEVVSANAGWNVNRIQAAACMLSSVFVSIALIAWAVYSFI